MAPVLALPFPVANASGENPNALPGATTEPQADGFALLLAVAQPPPPDGLVASLALLTADQPETTATSDPAAMLTALITALPPEEPTLAGADPALLELLAQAQPPVQTLPPSTAMPVQPPPDRLPTMTWPSEVLAVAEPLLTDAQPDVIRRPPPTSLVPVQADAWPQTPGTPDTRTSQPLPAASIAAVPLDQPVINQAAPQALPQVPPSAPPAPMAAPAQTPSQPQPHEQPATTPPILAEPLVPAAASLAPVAKPLTPIDDTQQPMANVPPATGDLPQTVPAKQPPTASTSAPVTPPSATQQPSQTWTAEAPAVPVAPPSADAVTQPASVDLPITKDTARPLPAAVPNPETATLPTDGQVQPMPAAPPTIAPEHADQPAPLPAATPQPVPNTAMTPGAADTHPTQAVTTAHANPSPAVVAPPASAPRPPTMHASPRSQVGGLRSATPAAPHRASPSNDPVASEPAHQMTPFTASDTRRDRPEEQTQTALPPVTTPPPMPAPVPSQMQTPTPAPAAPEAIPTAGTPVLGKAETEASPAPSANVPAPTAPTAPTAPAPIAAPERPTPPPNPFERVVAQQVSRAVVRHLPDGGERLTVRMTPPELGTVRVDFTLRDGVVTASLVAEDDGIRRALDRALPQMRTDVRDQHPGVDIVVAPGRDEGGRWQHDRQGQSSAQGQSQTQPGFDGGHRRQREDAPAPHHHPRSDAPADDQDDSAPRPQRQRGLDTLV